MSWRASGYVKEITVSPNGEKVTRTEKLVLLVLADSFNNDRGYAHPSIRLLSEQCLMSERMVQYCIRSLEKKSLLEVETGTGKGHGSRYRLPGLNSKDATLAPFTKDERVKHDVAKGATATAPEQEVAVIIERDAPAKLHPGQDLHPEQDLLPWMKDAWGKHPRTKEIPWEQPRFTYSFFRGEEFEGKEEFRAAFLTYLQTAKNPNPLSFLDTRPKPANTRRVSSLDPVVGEPRESPDVVPEPVDHTAVTAARRARLRQGIGVR